MDLHNREINRPSADPRSTMNITNEQFIYPNGINAFDPNLCSAAEYSPPPSTSYASTTDASITYSNAIFMPTIALNNQPADGVEAVKDETAVMEPSLPYKYVVAPDPRYTNSFPRNGEIVENMPELNHINGYVETAPHMIASTSNATCDENLVYHANAVEHHAEHCPQYSYIDTDYMHHSRDKHGRSDPEIVLQNSNGQLYRHVHNVYVNQGDAMNSVELMPTLINEAMVDGIGYATHETYNHTNGNEHAVAYEMHTNIDGSMCPTATEKQVLHSNGGEGMMQRGSIDLIYDTYKEQTQQYTMLETIDQNNVMQNGGGMHQDEPKTSYQSKCSMDEDQQRILLESTMSPLLAAVNDITAREEQYQSYLAQNKVTSPKTPADMSYYFNNDVNAHNVRPQVHAANCQFASNNKSRTIHATTATTSKSIFMGDCDSTRTSCASPTDEYVDINEMEFIDEPNGRKDENLLMRRSHRKKTAKKCEELMVVDRPVPSRAWATLPTSYLYFGYSAENPSLQVIFAKKDIPLRTKFGPFEGDIKEVDDDQLMEYRATYRDLPMLFVNQCSILDVSNEKTSNWMRFVYLATKSIEQNLLLYEIDEKLYFKSCQFIAPKQQLRVGYSKDYAIKYKLPLLMSTVQGQKFFEKLNPWQCSECSKRFPTAEKLEKHSNVHKTPESQTVAKLPVSTPSRQRTESSDASVTSSAGKCSNHRLNTGAIRKRKLALSKNSRASGPTVRYACCYCSKVFTKFLSYKKHTNSVHSKDVNNKRFTPKKPTQKSKENASTSACPRYFATQERSEEHQTLPNDENDSGVVQCEYCPKRVLTPSALTMHMRTHYAKDGLFQCPFCKERFHNTLLFKEHKTIHMVDGAYHCPHCETKFAKYPAIRKHIQLNHSTVRFCCSICAKQFKSKYKLKVHRLRHSDLRQFLCADCGKQFKRKDKLREHILKIHVAQSEPKPSGEPEDNKKKIPKIPKKRGRPPSSKSKQKDNNQSKIEAIDDSKSVKFCPKVAPTDYQRFIYKCNDCMVGFKRRGMLVNHMAKQHPDVSIDSVPELNLPILQTQRCYYCIYCEKVYKSNAKRKAHILKYHPGRELPQSTRQKSTVTDQAIGVLHDPSFSESISSVTTRALQCQWCYKQYASKTRLLQHQRKEHSNEVNCNLDAASNNDFFQGSTHHHMQDGYELTEQEHPSHDEYKLHSYNEQTLPHQRYIDFEPENKLLKLSSAALDFQFFDNDECEKEAIVDETSLSKVDVNFKVVGHEYADTSASSNCDLNPLPQLFEEICMTMKPTISGNADSRENNDAEK